MANRNRKHKITLYLSDDEMYILKNKSKLSSLGSMSAYLRNLIIYGYVYDVDYKFLHDYSVELSRISNLLNQKVWHTHESMLSKQPLISR